MFRLNPQECKAINLKQRPRSNNTFSCKIRWNGHHNQALFRTDWCRITIIAAMIRERILLGSYQKTYDKISIVDLTPCPANNLILNNPPLTT